jgi:ABC-type multidrug transport system ATPase subunit
LSRSLFFFTQMDREVTIDNLEEGELAFDGHFTVSPGSETLFTGRKCFLAVGDRLLLKDSCISLMKGRCYGLIGENGSGKSSLLRAIRDTMEDELNGKGGLTFSLVSQDAVEELEKED